MFGLNYESVKMDIQPRENTKNMNRKIIKNIKRDTYFTKYQRFAKKVAKI